MNLSVRISDLPRVEPHGFRFYASSVLRCSNGSTTATPAFSKSARFRVAMASPCTRAVAAIRLSLIGIARPDARRPAINSAQRRPVAASHGRQCSRPTPSANQRSSRARRRPRDRRRMPNRTSPRMIGSTTSCRSFFRSQATTSAFGAGFVGSLRTFASTRKVTTSRCFPTRLGRRNPSPGSSTANRRHPRVVSVFGGSVDTCLVRCVRHRTLDPARRHPAAGSRPATGSAPSWRRRSS